MATAMEASKVDLPRCALSGQPGIGHIALEAPGLDAINSIHLCTVKRMLPCLDIRFHGRTCEHLHSPP